MVYRPTCKQKHSQKINIFLKNYLKISFFCFFFYSLLVIIYLYVHIYAMVLMTEESPYEEVLSFYLEVPRIELRSSGLVASTFTC